MFVGAYTIRYINGNWALCKHVFQCFLVLRKAFVIRLGVKSSQIEVKLSKLRCNENEMICQLKKNETTSNQLSFVADLFADFTFAHIRIGFSMLMCLVCCVLCSAQRKRKRSSLALPLLLLPCIKNRCAFIVTRSFSGVGSLV